MAHTHTMRKYKQKTTVGWNKSAFQDLGEHQSVQKKKKKEKKNEKKHPTQANIPGVSKRSKQS